MTAIATFGNCQAHAVAYLLERTMPESDSSPVWFSNNRRTGRMESPDRILSTLNEADVVIYQPLGPRHGPLSTACLESSLNDSVTRVTFTRIFNTGIAGLCRAGFPPPGRSYRRIFGEEVVCERLEAGASVDDVVHEYRSGELSFNLRQRFDHCVQEMARRERSTQITLTDYIVENHQSRKLFISHNHPTMPLMADLCAQLKQLTGLPIDIDALRSLDHEYLEQLVKAGIFALRHVDCPISPHDLSELGCTFDPDPDWAEVGKKLISMIARDRDEEASAVTSQP